MLTYKLYYNIAPTYLWELISRKESYVNTCLGTDHQLVTLLIIISKCNSIMYATPCKLSEHNIRT